MSDYWNNRKGLMYYIFVRRLMKVLAIEARSLIDIGSRDARYMEWFTWIPVRHALDIERPYASDAVQGIRQDFLAYEPPERYDFALCLQVLEHVDEPARFARRILEVADRAIVSVPYRWPAGTHPNHVNDPVDEDKLFAWTGRKPDYHAVITEPLRRPQSAARLVAYYHPPGERFSVAEANARAKRIREERGIRFAQPD